MCTHNACPPIILAAVVDFCLVANASAQDKVALNYSKYFKYPDKAECVRTYFITLSKSCSHVHVHI